MVESQEGGGWRGGGEVVVVGVCGEAAIGGAVGEHGVRGSEAVDFDAHEGERGPAGEGPWSVRSVSMVFLFCIGSNTNIPHMETMMVAIFNDRTKGAKDIAAAKIRWLIIHAVVRSGLISCSFLTKGAMQCGGRGVNAFFSFSGDLTSQGSRSEPANVMIEKTTSESDPTRPMSPRVSLESSTLTCFE